MRRPSPFDYVVGNLLVLIGLFLFEAYLVVDYFRGDEQQLLLAIVVGVLLLWSNAAYQRVVALRRDDEEWRLMHGAAPRETLWRRLPRWLRFTVSLPFTAALLWFGYKFIQGFLSADGIWLPSPEEWFFALHGVIAPASEAMLAWLAAYAGQLALAIGVVVAGVILVRFLKRSRVSKVSSVRPAVERKWDGTVQVVLPIPKH